MRKCLISILLLLYVSLIFCSCSDNDKNSDESQITDSSIIDNADKDDSNIITSTAKGLRYYWETEDTKDPYYLSEEYYLSEAKRLGIYSDEYDEKLDALVLEKDSILFLKNAHDAYYGEDSNGLYNSALAFNESGQSLNWGEYWTYGDIARLIYAADCFRYTKQGENTVTLERQMKNNFHDYYGDFTENVFFMDVDAANEGDKSYYNDLSYYFWGQGMVTYATATVNPDIPYIANQDELYNAGLGNQVTYAITVYDRISGERLVSLDENDNFPLNERPTIKDCILMAFHYYRSFIEEPEMVCIDDIGTYNKDIITDELLSKETTLPEPTNQKLPADWKGVFVAYNTDAMYERGYHQWDLSFTEREMDMIDEFGFNYIRLGTSWYRMQDPYFNEGDEVNIKQLEYLDRIIAWAIERDIHINICFQDTPGMDLKEYTVAEWTEEDIFQNAIFTDENLQKEAVRYFRALAKRYADIPNTYLSFELSNECEPMSDEEYVNAYKPVVEAIWEESPDRVVMACVQSYTAITGESMAELGCCLDFHNYNPIPFCEISYATEAQNPGYYKNMTWPYVAEDGTVIDMEAAKDIVAYADAYSDASYNSVRNVALENNVGYINAEIGYFLWQDAALDYMPLCSVETREAYYDDMVSSYAKDETPWVINWQTGLVVSYPLKVNNESYPWEKCEGTKWYIDPYMRDYWKEKNKE